MGVVLDEHDGAAQGARSGRGVVGRPGLRLRGGVGEDGQRRGGQQVGGVRGDERRHGLGVAEEVGGEGGGRAPPVREGGRRGTQRGEVGWVGLVGEVTGGPVHHGQGQRDRAHIDVHGADGMRAARRPREGDIARTQLVRPAGVPALGGADPQIGDDHLRGGLRGEDEVAWQPVMAGTERSGVGVLQAEDRAGRWSSHPDARAVGGAELPPRLLGFGGDQPMGDGRTERRRAGGVDRSLLGAGLGRHQHGGAVLGERPAGRPGVADQLLERRVGRAGRLLHHHARGAPDQRRVGQLPPQAAYAVALPARVLVVLRGHGVLRIGPAGFLPAPRRGVSALAATHRVRTRAGSVNPRCAGRMVIGFLENSAGTDAWRR